MAKKRANGEGSIRRKPNGRWEGRYTQGIDPSTGRAIQKSVSAKTRAECKEKLDRAIRDKLTVAQTEALVESMLRSPPPKKRRPTLIVKDVRLFLNTISHSLDVMRSAGVDAQCQRQDAPDAITLTIRIPTPPRP